MTRKQFKGEKDYHMALYLAEEIHRQGLLGDEEFEKTREKLISQYQPVVSSLIGEI
jgi:hypothetical protein